MAASRRRLRTVSNHFACSVASAPLDVITPQHAEFVSYQPVPRFEPGSAEASDFLDREGFCVFREVLSAAEVAHTLDKIWWFLEAQVTQAVFLYSHVFMMAQSMRCSIVLTTAP
jgi:hypothetical protein